MNIEELKARHKKHSDVGSLGMVISLPEIAELLATLEGKQFAAASHLKTVESQQRIIASYQATERAAIQPACDAAHPVQPLVTDAQGCTRFKENSIVRHLADGKLNDLACMDFPQEDWEQLAQLIGYSLSGFGTLSYVTDDTYDRAASQEVAATASPSQPEANPYVKALADLLTRKAILPRLEEEPLEAWAFRSIMELATSSPKPVSGEPVLLPRAWHSYQTSSDSDFSATWAPAYTEGQMLAYGQAREDAALAGAVSAEREVQEGFNNGMDLVQRFTNVRNEALKEAALLCSGYANKQTSMYKLACNHCTHGIRNLQSAPVASAYHIPGLGRCTDEDDGFVTLQFKDEASAQAFMHAYHPTVESDDMPVASAQEDDNTENEWRRLALQFDGHRMQALRHLKCMVQDAETHREQAEKFLSARPLSGEQVLSDRIRAISSSTQCDALTDEEIYYACSDIFQGKYPNWILYDRAIARVIESLVLARLRGQKGGDD